MRKLIVTTIMSLDGYFEGPGGNVMALPMDPRFDEHNVQRLREADTLLLGRTTFDGFKSFWPAMPDNPDASADTRETGRLNNAIQKVVVSDSLTTDETDPWRDTTRIVRRAAAHKEIAELKAGPGRDIVTFGSHILFNDLLAAGLVDELHVILGSTVLGGGTPAFTAGLAPLRMIDAHTFADSDNIIIRYAPR